MKEISFNKDDEIFDNFFKKLIDPNEKLDYETNGFLYNLINDSQMSGYVYESDEIKYLLSLFDKIDGFKYLTDNYMELSEAIECVKSFDESVISKKCFIVTFQEIFNTEYIYFVEK